MRSSTYCIMSQSNWVWDKWPFTERCTVMKPKNETIKFSLEATLPAYENQDLSIVPETINLDLSLRPGKHT